MKAPLSSLAIVLLGASSSFASSPKPYGAVPSERQLVWHDMEQYAFIHFGLNAYTDREWGYGDEDPSRFNPKDFDADKTMVALKSAGLKGVIFTCKHHDGFCLWPTKTTSHNITKSPFRGGKGDMVREISDAARRAGLKFGVYVSPWDRNHPAYGTPAYVKVYHEQIRELLTNYGEIFEIWFDGANGGDGYYGGKREKRQIDNKTYYRWPDVHPMVRRLQPKAVIFGDGGPDVRWVGNEHGEAGDPCRPTIDARGWSPGNYIEAHLGAGVKGGPQWIPAECDVSIRPGWFWHESENARVRTPGNLFDLYCKSVGRGGSFLLNVPLDTRGLVHENDVRSLARFGALLRATFADNLARDAKFSVSSRRAGAEREFGAVNLVDPDKHSYWTPEESDKAPSFTAEFAAPKTFNLIRLREAIKLGARVEDWRVEVRENGAWRDYAKGKVIGAGRLVRGAPVTADAVRISFSGGEVAPCIGDFGVYAEPSDPGSAVIARSRDGAVSMSGGTGAVVRYTLDGSEPTEDSPAYSAPLPMARGGVVKAKAFAGKASGDTVTRVFGLAKAKWKVAGSSCDNEGKSALAIDDDVKTLWHTHTSEGRQPPPQWVAVDMGESVKVSAFTLTPRTDGASFGVPDRYRFEVSGDGVAWRAVAEGEFSNIRANPLEQTVKLAAPESARFFRFAGLRCLEGEQICLAELGVLAAE